MKRAIAAVILSCAFACGGRGPNAPTGAGGMSKPIADAITTEATSPETALDAWAKVLTSAAWADGDPWQTFAIGAAIDALVMRSAPGLGSDGAILYRVADPRASTSKDLLREAIERAMIAAKGPFAKGLIAWAGERISEHRGDANAAADFRKARGCASEATVIGPLTWAPVSGVAEPDPLANADAKIERAYAGDGAFAKKIEPVIVRAKGCWIDLEAESALSGVRDVVVDVDVPEAQTIGVALRSQSTSILRVGGKIAIDRPYDLGGDPVTRFARVDVTKGRLRIVARVGADQQGEAITIQAWSADGSPLLMRAPRPGEIATARANAATPVTPPPLRTDDDRIAIGAASLAFGEPKHAERVLREVAARADASLAALSVYARAVGCARDLTPTRRAERTRAIWDRVLQQWPSSWEAVLAHAELAADRKGRSEARMAALEDLDAHRAQVKGLGAALLDAYDAMSSGQEGLYDRARAALGRAKGPLAATAILFDAERAAGARSGRERIAFECRHDSARNADDLTCYDALADAGELDKAEAELSRVRAVRGADAAYLPLSLQTALARGDLDGAKKIFEKMLPGERTFAAFALLERPKDRAAIGRVAASSSDGTNTIAPMLRWLGQDGTAAFDDIAEQATLADRKKPALAEAGTAILQHIETYDVDELGLLHMTFLDVRRVGGTTDVEENAQAPAPEIMGRATMRTIRRRIFKKDGRILTPDPTPNAAQAHADLAQLERGDVVESVYEAWALPQAAGDLGVDTPDLLPERTAVAHATIEIRLPASLKVTMWSHPLLGPPKELKEGSQRVLRWQIDDKPTRRIEQGAPKMDRGARVSWSTATWDHVARGMREVLAALGDHDAEVDAWAKEAAKGKTGRDLVEAVVTKAGETIRESSAGLLSDFTAGRSSGPQGYTARTILSEREGSRSWVIMRALRSLGVDAELGVAENEPYSANPHFPAHYGRFLHPLVIAHILGKDGKREDVWIDADVSGPPLPAGRVSPELRGRAVLMTDGRITQAPLSGSESERDEIDLRLVLDSSGDAKGTLTVLLRGRAAQEISEAMLRVVGLERDRALRNIALAWLPFADIERVVLSSSEGSWQVSLRADVSVKRYAQPEGKGDQTTWVLPGLEPLHTVFPRPWVTTLAAAYAGQGGRQEALAISRAVQYHAHRRIELPSGSTVVRAPSPLEVRTPNLTATRRITSQGAIDEEFMLTVTTGTVPADRYGAFVGDARRIDAAFLASTRIKPAK